MIENKTTNFNETLPTPTNERAKELLKNPYIFDFITAGKDFSNNTVVLVANFHEVKDVEEEPCYTELFCRL